MQLNLRGNLDWGVPLPPAPPLSPSSPVGWIPPLSTPPPSMTGPIHQGHPQRRMTGSGPHCCPSCPQQLRIAAIWDVLEVVGQFRTWEVEHQLGDTGAKPLFTQWVNGGFIVGSETKCPAWTQLVHFNYFYNSPTNLPSMGPPGTWWIFSKRT